jgi:hypothetical protein
MLQQHNHKKRRRQPAAICHQPAAAHAAIHWKNKMMTISKPKNSIIRNSLTAKIIIER